MTSPFPSAPTAPHGWVQLDWPGQPLFIQGTSGYERTWRSMPCKKEPWTAGWITMFDPTRDCFWDVGANVGGYVLIAAACGIPTVALEPTYPSFAALCHNVIANKLEHIVTPICLAASNNAAVVPIAYRSLEAGAASHGFGVGVKKPKATVPTAALPLDVLAQMFGLRPPTRMLVDVDGAELAVLQGAVQLLTHTVDELMIELPDGGSHVPEVVELLASCGMVESERWTTREDLPMAGVYYALFKRRE